MSVQRFATMILVLLASATCLAQLDTATILGTVSDATGAVIVGAKVVIQNTGTSAVIELTTNGSGYFIAPVLSVGTYRVTVTAPGFKTHRQEAIALSVADRLNLAIVLQPGQVTEEVKVEAGAVLVQTATSARGDVISGQLTEDLPLNGRSVTDLMLLVPGMVASAPPTINGGADGRLFQPGLKYLVDGGDSSQIDSDFASGDYLTSARVNRVSVDAVSEFRMVTGTYSAEYGQSTGAVVNFITKSGANTLHGGLFEFFRNEVLDSRLYFNRPPEKKPAFRLNQFGGSLGGPIVRDKLFFFGNYEGVRQRSGLALSQYVFTDAYRATLAPALQPVVAQMPSPNGAVSAADNRLALFTEAVSDSLREDTWTGKIDYLASPKDRVTFGYNGDNSFTKSYFGVSDGQFRPIPFTKHLVKLSYTRTISNTLLNEASFAINRLSADPAGAGTPEARSFPQTTFVFGGISFGAGGLATVGPSTFDQQVDNTAYQIYDSVSWVKGRHQLKFGAQIVRNQDNKAVVLQKFVQFLGISGPFGFETNTPFFIYTLGWPRVGMRGTYWAFYVNDDFKVSDRLTVNAGLRYQYDSTPTESQGRVANFNPATGQLDPEGTSMLNAPKTNFGPRLGFAYSLDKGQQTVLRGGYGIFFANLNPALAQFVPSNLPGVGQNGFALFPPVGFPFPDLSGGSVLPVWAMKKDWSGTYTQQWNLGVQRGIGKTMVFELSYIGNRALHVLTAGNGQELNPIDPATGLRPYPAFASIQMQNPCCNANYHGLQASFKRQAAAFTFGAHYTWAHAFDENTLTFAAQAQNPADLTRGEYATADYDVRHNFVFYGDYQIPKLGKLPAWLGENWLLRGITSMRSGLPITVICGCDPTGNGSATGRPDLVSGVSLRPANYSIPDNQVNIAAFTAPVGHFGDARRNLLAGPAVYNTDFGVSKIFRLTESQRIEFRAEMFNIFNTPQFANPEANLASPATFGQTFSTIGTNSGFGTNRQVQFALKYLF
jgi:hypothetical protein